jgi:hypothetical protein
MAIEFQEPRLVAGYDGRLYVAQCITPEDIKKFKEVVTRNFPRDSNLLNTYDANGRGSSVFGNIVMAGVLLESGWNIADLPQIYEANRTFDVNQDNGFGISTRGCYSDGRFLIRKKNEATEHVLAQIGDKKLTQDEKGVLKMPLSFPFTGLKLEPSGPLQGYSIKLTSQANVFASPQYSTRNKIGKFSLFDADGNPILDEDGRYALYNNDNSVARVYAGDDLDLYSRIGDLGDFDGDGRVVKYRAAGTEKNLAARLAEVRNANFGVLVERVKERHASELRKIEEFRSSFPQ